MKESQRIVQCGPGCMVDFRVRLLQSWGLPFLSQLKVVMPTIPLCPYILLIIQVQAFSFP